MSMLPPEVNIELAQLLQALQSADNNVRSQAEEHLATHWTNEKPDVLLMGLVEQIQGSTDTTVREPHALHRPPSDANSFHRRGPLLQSSSDE